MSFAPKREPSRERTQREHPRFVEVNGALVERDAGVPMGRRIARADRVSRPSVEIKGALPDETRAIIV
jgi:RecB family exonuclease